jgi:uncharacterized protein
MATAQTTLVPSRHNILSRLEGSEHYLIVNPLSRSADLLTADVAKAALAGRFHDPEEWSAKGYLVDPEEESRRYRAAYLEFLDARERAELQAFFIPTYLCNFGCSYCYQSEYPQGAGGCTPEVVEGFYSYLDRELAGREKYVTLFGGEPLLPGREARTAVATLVSGAAARGLGLAVVTNGYHLADYLEILQGASIREIQVTLDGLEAIHDRRRPLKSGGPTFGAVHAGIEAALDGGLPINLRVVVDRENLEALPELARHAASRGWTESPLFKTQIGRNYELHSCQGSEEKLLSRAQLHRALYDLARRSPEVLAFHRPAFSLSRFLFDSGELPDPLFDGCPGCKTEWAFDYTGRIYPCTAVVGKPGQEVGRFHPTVERNEERIALWEERDVTSIESCRGCSLQLACGGGCAAVAENAHGLLQAPDCRPVPEALSLGLSLYFRDDIDELDEE